MTRWAAGLDRERDLSHRKLLLREIAPERGLGRSQSLRPTPRAGKPSDGAGPPAAPLLLVLAAEDLADRGVLEHGVDGVGDEPATERTSILSMRFSGGSGSVLVMTTCSIAGVLQPVDGRVREHPVGGHGPHSVAPPRSGDRRRPRWCRRCRSCRRAGCSAGRRRCRSTSVASTKLLARPWAGSCCTKARSARELVGEALRPTFTPPASGDTMTRSAGQCLAVVDQHGHGGEVVDRDVEEALDLAGVEVDAERPGRRRRPANMSATSLAVMGSRPSALRSWRE